MGILLPFNKLVYPGGWARSRLNTPFMQGIGLSHVLWAGVAIPNAGFIRLDKPGDLGTRSGVIGGINNHIGPYVAAGASNDVITYTVAAPQVVNGGVALACICSFGGIPLVIDNATFATAVQMYMTGTNISNYSLGSVVASISGVNTSHQFFVVVGANFGTTTNYYVAALDLVTGMMAYSAAATGTTTFSTSQTVRLLNYVIGGQGSAPIATAAVINNALTQAQIFQWFKTPWDFWYSPIQNTLMVKTPTMVPSTAKSAILLAGL